jgi:hypothetical protein
VEVAKGSGGKTQTYRQCYCGMEMCRKWKNHLQAGCREAAAHIGDVFKTESGDGALGDNDDGGDGSDGRSNGGGGMGVNAADLSSPPPRPAPSFSAKFNEFETAEEQLEAAFASQAVAAPWPADNLLTAATESKPPTVEAIKLMKLRELEAEGERAEARVQSLYSAYKAAAASAKTVAAKLKHRQLEKQMWKNLKKRQADMQPPSSDEEEGGH